MLKNFSGIFETYLVFLELTCSISFSTSFKEASSKENGVVTLMFLINKTLAWATYWSMPFSIVPACSLVSSLIKEFSFQKPRSQMLFKIGVHKNFAIFTGKDQCWSLSC